MICAFFPPASAVGAKRSGRLYKVLKNVDWRPIVLTIKPPNKSFQDDDHVFGTNWIDLRCLTSFLNAIVSRICSLLRIKYDKNWIDDALLIPDAWIGWAPFCFWRGYKILKMHPQDIIYVSCSPFSSLIPAVILKKIFKAKLIVDFRDPWTLNPHNTHSGWHRYLIEKIERWTMSNADHLILNSPGSLELHREKYPTVKMSYLPNGLEQGIQYWRQLRQVMPKLTKERFTIYHAGNFSGNRNPALLFDAISRQKNKFQFKFICPAEKWALKYLRQLANDYGVIDLCEFVPYQTEQETHRSLLKADLLYLKQGFEQKTNHCYVAIAAKTYEYLASGRPILLECPMGDNYNIVTRYAKKVYTVTENDLGMMEKALFSAYEEWKDGLVDIQGPDGSFFNEFSPGNLGNTFKMILSSV